MLKSVNDKYFLTETLHKTPLYQAYLGKNEAGEKVLIWQAGPVTGDPQGEGFLGRTFYATQCKPGSSIVVPSELQREGDYVYMASQPYMGVSVKEYMKLAPPPGVSRALGMFAPLLEDVSSMWQQGAAFIDINEDVCYINNNKLILLSFGQKIESPGDGVVTVELLAKLLYALICGKPYSGQTLTMQNITSPGNFEGVLLNGINNMSFYNYPDPVSFQEALLKSGAMNLIKPPVPGPGYAAGGYAPANPPASYPPGIPNIPGTNNLAPAYSGRGYKKPISNKKFAFIIIGLIAAVVFSTGLIYAVSFSLTAGAMGVLRNSNSYSAPMATAVPVPAMPTFSPDEWAEEENYFGDAQVITDLGDNSIAFNGMIAEYGGKVYYRQFDEGLYHFYQEDAGSGNKTVLLEYCAPAFITVNQDGIYFSDALSDYRMFFLPHGSDEPELVVDAQCWFNTMSLDGQSIYYTDGEQGSFLSVYNTQDKSIVQLHDDEYVTYPVAAEDRVFYSRYDGYSYYLQSLQIDPQTLRYTDYGPMSGIGNIVSGEYVYFINEGFNGDLCRYHVNTDYMEYVVTEVYWYQIYDDKIYYIDASGDYRLYVCDMDGTNSQLVIDNDLTYFQIAGNFIYFINEDGYGSLCRMPIEGGIPEVLDTGREYMGED